VAQFGLHFHALLILYIHCVDHYQLSRYCVLVNIASSYIASIKEIDIIHRLLCQRKFSSFYVSYCITTFIAIFSSSNSSGGIALFLWQMVSG